MTQRASPASLRPVPRPWALREIVGELRQASESFGGEHLRGPRRHTLPSREALVGFTSSLRAALFPAHFGVPDLEGEEVDYFVGHTLDSALAALHEQVRRGLHFDCAEQGPDCARCRSRAGEATRDFAAQLPAIRTLLGTDVRAAFEGDPAATSLDEALFCYPGVSAITLHRVAHALHRLEIPLIPRIISEISHAETGIDIHPGAEIGASFFIDHGTGVVIGETCLLGERVRIYQGVTLGAKSFPLDDQGRPIKGTTRHPVVEDDVVIYAGATILGRITIGRGSTIGGNVWLTRSVPPQSQVTQALARSEVFEGGLGI